MHVKLFSLSHITFQSQSRGHLMPEPYAAFKSQRRTGKMGHFTAQTHNIHVLTQWDAHIHNHFYLCVKNQP